MMLVGLGRGQVDSRNDAGDRLQGIRLTSGDDAYTLCGHALLEALPAACGDQHIQRIQGMLIPAKLVH